MPDGKSRDRYWTTPFLVRGFLHQSTDETQQRSVLWPVPTGTEKCSNIEVGDLPT